MHVGNDTPHKHDKLLASLSSHTGANNVDREVFTSWLLGPARNLDIMGVIDGFGRLCGMRALPFHRIVVFLFSIHPMVRASNYIWSINTLQTEEQAFPYNREQTENPPENFVKSPIYRLFNGLDAFIHRPLHAPDCPMDFPILEDLKSEGATDYLSFSLHRSQDSSVIMAMSLATYQGGGFGEHALELLKHIIPPLSIVLELANSRFMTRTILDTYVGKRSGELVLQGRIHKGDGEIIPAVIWFCDLRAFTALTAHEGMEDLVDSLNDFFACMVDSIDSAGGEVLKFMGDALLAIFPLPQDREHFASMVSEAALVAAEEAKDKIAELNRVRQEKGKWVLQFGVSVHVGDVMYGNIGGGARLDFTVLGNAVNLASRLQNVCAESGRVIVVSDDFRCLSKRDFEHIGDFALKGIAKTESVYALKRKSDEC